MIPPLSGFSRNNSHKTCGVSGGSKVYYNSKSLHAGGAWFGLVLLFSGSARKSVWNIAVNFDIRAILFKNRVKYRLFDSAILKILIPFDMLSPRRCKCDVQSSYG